MNIQEKVPASSSPNHEYQPYLRTRMKLCQPKLPDPDGIRAFKEPKKVSSNLPESDLTKNAIDYEKLYKNV